MFLNILNVVLYTAAVLIALLLVVLVLVQPSKDGGFGSAFGGVGEGVFGAQTMGVLSKITVWLIVLFFVVTLGLAALSGYMKKTSATAADSAVLQGMTASPVQKTDAGKTDVKKAEPAVKADVKKAEPAAKKADGQKNKDKKN